jgi:hypothetical protein
VANQLLVVLKFSEELYNKRNQQMVNVKAVGLLSEIPIHN